MTSDALTRLLHFQSGAVAPNGHRDRAPEPDPADEVNQLRAALVSSRRISMAMGILMRDRDVDEDQAFACLRRMSQDSNRKLRDVAEDVIGHRRRPPGPQ